MGKYVTIPLVILDNKRRKIAGLSVKTGYAGGKSRLEHVSDARGYVDVVASPNRPVEIHVKRPDGGYELNVTLNSTKASVKRQKIVLPRTIDAYKKKPTSKPSGTKQNGLVDITFTVVDKNGKVFPNFPIKTQPVGRKKSAARYTDEKGMLTIEASPNRDVNLFVLSTADQFEKIKTFNTKTGEKLNIKLSQPRKAYMAKTPLKIYDYTGKKIYPKLKILIDYMGNHAEKTLTGNITLTTMLGEEIKITPLKPDGSKLKPIVHVASRLSDKEVTLNMPCHLKQCQTSEGEPNVNQNVKNSIALITMAQMKKMFPKAPESRLKLVLDGLNQDLVGYKLDTHLRKAHFMAQVRQEVGPKMLFREELEYYRKQTLFANFRNYRNNPKWAERDAYVPGKKLGNVRNICNVAYSNRMGNGSIKSGDGYLYRGRGLKQLTGKSNYRDFTKGYRKIWGENNNFVANPELLEQSKYCVRSGVWFWLDKKLYDIADKGAKPEDVNAITRIINRDTPESSYRARRTHFRQAYKVFGTK